MFRCLPPHCRVQSLHQGKGGMPTFFWDLLLSLFRNKVFVSLEIMQPCPRDENEAGITVHLAQDHSLYRTRERGERERERTLNYHFLVWSIVGIEGGWLLGHSAPCGRSAHPWPAHQMPVALSLVLTIKDIFRYRQHPLGGKIPLCPLSFHPSAHLC